MNSTAVHVAHLGTSDSAKEVEIFYVRDGKPESIRGANCVLACYNGMIPYLCPELPEKQREALSYLVKCATRVYARRDSELDIIPETGRAANCCAW